MKLDQNKVLNVFDLDADYQKFVLNNFQKANSRRPRVVILNDYMPAYRAQLFDKVEKKLGSQSIDFMLITGNPDKKFLLRRDMTTAPFHIVANNFSVRVGRSSIRYIFARKYTKSADIIVCEYSVTNLNTWLHILFDKKKTIFLWGHGPGYLAKQSWLRTSLELFLARKASKVLTYTMPGMARLVELGLEPEKVEYLNNTFDWGPIGQSILETDEVTVSDYIESKSLTPGKIFCFIGALDETKRIDFLADAMDFAWEIDKEVRFLFAGEGPDKDKLANATSRGQAVLLGRIGNSEKGILAKISSGILNPGNIGLVAVDSLAMNTPIIGTNVRSSPEKDYLVEGLSLYTLSNNPAAFADELISFLQQDKQKVSFGKPPLLEDFAERFSLSLVHKIRPEKPRILFLTNLPAPYRISLFNSMAKDFEVIVGFTGWADEGRDWLLPQRDELKFKVVNVGRLFGAGRFKTPVPRVNLLSLIRGSNMVVVGGWNSPVYILALMLAKRIKVRSAVWFESTIQSSVSQGRYLKGLKAWVFSMGTFVITPGDSASKAVLTYSSNKVPIVQISNPVEEIYLQLPKNHSQARDSRTGTKYLYFGRLLSWKRVDRLIAAFDLMSDEHDTLTIIGSGHEEKKLKELAQTALRSNQIHFLDAVAHTEAIPNYKHYDVLVLPSVREVWGMVVPEALLLGLNVVADVSVGCVATYKSIDSLFLYASNSIDAQAESLRRAKVPMLITQDQAKQLNLLNSTSEFSTRFRYLYDELEKSGSR